VKYVLHFTKNFEEGKCLYTPAIGSSLSFKINRIMIFF